MPCGLYTLARDRVSSMPSSDATVPPAPSASTSMVPRSRADDQASAAANPVAPLPARTPATPTRSGATSASSRVDRRRGRLGPVGDRRQHLLGLLQRVRLAAGHLDTRGLHRDQVDARD